MSTQLTPESIRQIIEAAVRENRRVRLEGYVDNEGNAQDLIVELLPGNGYDALIKESLEELRTWDLKTALEICGVLSIEGQEVPPPLELVAQALADLRDSWESRLNTPKEARQASTSGRDLQRQPLGWYSTEQEPELTVLLGLKRHARSVVVPKEASTRKTTPKWGISKVKERLTSKLPIGSYLGRLNLRPQRLRNLSLQ